MTPEQVVRREICEWLEARGSLFTLHQRTYSRKFGATKFALNGWPDIHGVWVDGKALLIEVKAPGGSISEAQMRIVSRAKELGAHAFFAYSLADVRHELT